MLRDCRAPSRAPSPRLKSMLQQMNKEHHQPIPDLATVAARHAFEFLGDVLQVEALRLAAPGASRLIIEPGDEVFLITGGVSRQCHACHRAQSGSEPQLPFYQVSGLAFFEYRRVPGQ